MEFFLTQEKISGYSRSALPPRFSLGYGVAVADGDALFVPFKGVKVDCDTKRCADFIVAPIGFADIANVFVILILPRPNF